ncbi:DNA cytosine methyltransferase [Rhodococcus aetherivorans]|uniref:DNA cytosine methyltransferase n=1 Tax=Rhodococcus aetherivorans TaxID=191292 RepID=UPI002E0DB747
MTAAPRPSSVANPHIVDLFAGPGGLDVAATWLGVPVVGIEWDANACATRRAAGLETQQGDVRDFGRRTFPKRTFSQVAPHARRTRSPGQVPVAWHSSVYSGWSSR